MDDISIFKEINLSNKAYLNKIIFSTDIYKSILDIDQIKNDFIDSKNKRLFLLEYIESLEVENENKRKESIFIYSIIVNHILNLNSQSNLNNSNVNNSHILNINDINNMSISSIFDSDEYIYIFLLNIQYYIKKIERFNMGKDYEEYIKKKELAQLPFSFKSYIEYNFILKVLLTILYSIIYNTYTSTSKLKMRILYNLKYINQDFLEDNMFSIIKNHINHKFLPINICLSIYLLYLYIIFTKDISNVNINVIHGKEGVVCTERKNISNIDLNRIELKKEINKISNGNVKFPNYFFDYKKKDCFIEKFYRKNILQIEKTEDQAFIFSLLNLLLVIKDDINLYITTYTSVGNSKDITSDTNNLIKISSNEIILLKIYELLMNDQDKQSIPIMTLVNDFSKFSNEEILNENLNRINTSYLIIQIYLLVIKTLKEWNIVQYLYFIKTIAEKNGLMVYLKALNIDYKQLISVSSSFNMSSKGSIENNVNLNLDYSVILVRTIKRLITTNLKLLYKVFKDKDDYIYKFLYENYIYKILKKLLLLFNQDDEIKKYSLKLIKIQIKFFDKNLRAEYISIIGSIFLYLKHDPCLDNHYLKFKKEENILYKNNYDDSISIEEYKKFLGEYNYCHYLKFYSNSVLVNEYLVSLNSSPYMRVMNRLCFVVEDGRKVL